MLHFCWIKGSRMAGSQVRCMCKRIQYSRAVCPGAVILHFPWKHLAIRIVHLPKSATPVSVNPCLLVALGVPSWPQPLDLVGRAWPWMWMKPFSSDIYTIFKHRCTLSRLINVR